MQGTVPGQEDADLSKNKTKEKDKIRKQTKNCLASALAYRLYRASKSALSLFVCLFFLICKTWNP